jgi:hypothetical protein
MDGNSKGRRTPGRLEAPPARSSAGGRVRPSTPKLGVDFGRVINDALSHPIGDDTAFLGGTEEEMLETPVMRGAFDVLGRLVTTFEGRVWVISKCGPKVQDRTERWLTHHRFFELTGVAQDHIRFCRQRAEKADHCRQLGITHFVDDRYDVLTHLQGVVQHLFLFGPQETVQPPPTISTPSWEDVEHAILVTL